MSESVGTRPRMSGLGAKHHTAGRLSGGWRTPIVGAVLVIAAVGITGVASPGSSPGACTAWRAPAWEGTAWERPKP